MKISISKDSDPNYLATVVKCPKIKEHPNADRLSLIEIFGNTVIIQKDTYTEGEKLVYFPVECCIDKAFLSWANLLDNVGLNRDGKTKGFFGKQCRVKAIKLREIPSQGFVFKVSLLTKYYEIKEDVFSIGVSFDTVGERILVKKYIKPTQVQQTQNVNKYRKTFSKIIKPFPRPVRKFLNVGYDKVDSWLRKPSIQKSILNDAFAFHGKTEHLGKNIFILNPTDVISVSEKLHGTSAIYGNLECKKSFNPFRKLYGGKDTEHKIVYASRSRILNRKANMTDNSVWGVIKNRIEKTIPKDFLIYGEIVGHTEQGKCIQKGYDYGEEEFNAEFYVYRVVQIEGDKKYEIDALTMIDFCKDFGLTHVPFHCYGFAEDLYDVPTDDIHLWREQFLAKLKEEYFLKQCKMCKNKVMNEGVVVRIENSKAQAFKFKNPDFVIKESASRDKGEADMEEDS